MVKKKKLSVRGIYLEASKAYHRLLPWQTSTGTDLEIGVFTYKNNTLVFTVTKSVEFVQGTDKQWVDTSWYKLSMLNADFRADFADYTLSTSDDKEVVEAIKKMIKRYEKVLVAKTNGV